MISAETILKLANISKEDQQACFEFFILFSRFEYALKRWGCADKNSPELKVNWDDAARKLATKCDVLIQEIRQKNGEIFSHPPKKQVRADNGFAWKETNTTTMTETRRALFHLCNVRNNLFHGGKWPNEGPVVDSVRNRTLIAEAIELIRTFVESDDTLKSLYLEFA